MSENKQKLIELCKAKGAKIQGTEHLIAYYQKALGWSEPHGSTKRVWRIARFSR